MPSIYITNSEASEADRKGHHLRANGKEQAQISVGHILLNIRSALSLDSNCKDDDTTGTVEKKL